MRKFFCFFYLILLTWYGAIGQNQLPAAGMIVAAETGKPLSDVTIRMKESHRSVTSDRNGRFRIVPTQFPDSLMVSHVGYLPARLLVTRAAQNIVIRLLPDVTALEPVTVNTGYQRVKPNEINGAAVLIDNKTLNQQTGTNILKRLEGVASGVAFNEGYSNGNAQNKTGISIRGTSTISGPLDPLIVLDNFVFEGNITNINPNDIESVSILKDAAAASIWGARAGNGVIVITTKKGRFNQPLKIDWSEGIILTERPRLAAIPDMSVSDYIDVETGLFNQGYFDGQVSQPYQALTPLGEMLLQRRNGDISAADSAAASARLKQQSTRKQFDQYFYQTGITQQHSLTLRGGSNNLAWLVSGAYDRTLSTLGATDSKVNFRFANTYRPIQKLQLDLSVYYTNDKNISGKYPYGTVSTVNGRNVPYLQLASPDGTALPVRSFYRGSYTDTAGGGKLLDWNNYPLDDSRHNQSVNRLDEMIANLGFHYQLLKPVSLDISYQYQQQRNSMENDADLQSYSTRNTINLFTQIDPGDGSVRHNVPVGDILTESFANQQSQNVRGQLNGQHSWGAHEITVIAGAELRDIHSSGNSFIYYGYQAYPLVFANVDFVNPYPTFINGGYQTISGPRALTETTNRFVSVYGNLSYRFKERYTFSASARKDGSNILGVRTNDKWKPLWSVGLGWEVSRERFYRQAWLPYLKIKSTYGYSGNVDLSRTALPLAGYGNDYLTNLPVAAIGTINNPDLRWEQIGQFNFGTEFQLRNQWLSGSIDYYVKKGTDLYGRAPFDYTAWGRQSFLTRNVANMKGTGVDVLLNARWLNHAFSWTTALLYNYNLSKTTKYLDPSAQTLSSLVGGGKSITPVTGKPLYSVAAYRWGGLDSAGNPTGYLDGVRSSDYDALITGTTDTGGVSPIVYVGPSVPTSFGSVINTFSWKGFSLSVNIAFRAGYYFIKPALSYSGLVSSGFGTPDFARRWKNPGDENTTTVPSFVYPVNSSRDMLYASSTVNVLKADHLRLQYIHLNYQCDPAGAKIFRHLELYAHAANLGILWRANQQHLDPDSPYALPAPVSYSLGFRSSF